LLNRIIAQAGGFFREVTMDVKKTAEQLHALTREQATEIISTLEGWGYKDVMVGYQAVMHGKNKCVSERPSDKVIHVSIEATFYEDDE
jgi:hypothetical protein